jgi:hypothetical protein
LHTGLRVHRAPGFPCALLILEGNDPCTTRAKSRRENAKPYLDAVIARSACDDAIHGSSFAARRIASLALAMTIGGLFEIRILHEGGAA